MVELGLIGVLGGYNGLRGLRFGFEDFRFNG